MVVGETTIDVDVLVIGGGPGGYVAAVRAAQLGRKVTLVEREALGGVCLNVGCIPSKFLIAVAHDVDRLKRAAAYGLFVEGFGVDFSKVQEWKADVVRTLTGGVEKLLRGNGAEIVRGEAYFLGPQEVRIFERENVYTNYRFQASIVAVGSRPIELPGFPFGGLDGRILSSTEALALPEIPRRLVVIGGGYIGIELGQAYAKLGSRVTIVEEAARILPAFEEDLVRPVKRQLMADGVTVLEGAKALVAEATEEGVRVHVETKGGVREFPADYVLVTVGRRPNTDELGLKEVGVRMDERGHVIVDERMATSVSGIYAVGDIVRGPALAHKASAEGKAAAEAIAGIPGAAADFRAVPAVVYSDPEVAVVGLTAAEAEEAGYRVRVGTFPMAASGRALTLGKKDGFVRLVGDAETGAILGAQAVGLGASELIAELGFAVEMGATAEDVALAVHAHPTLAETAMEAAEAFLGRPIHILNKSLTSLK